MLGYRYLGFETVKSVIHPNVDVVLFGGTAAFLGLILYRPSFAVSFFIKSFCYVIFFITILRFASCELNHCAMFYRFSYACDHAAVFGTEA
jgi:hypothetical protein